MYNPKSEILRCDTRVESVSIDRVDHPLYHMVSENEPLPVPLASRNVVSKHEPLPDVEPAFGYFFFLI